MKFCFRFLWCLPLLGLLACNQFSELEDIDGVNSSREFAVPLINTKLSINDILENFEENASLVVSPDGLLRFQYSGSILTKTAEEIFEIINDDLGVGSLIPIAITGSRQALPFSSPNGLQFDRLEIKEGGLLYRIANDHTLPIAVTIMLPNVTKNGVPLTVTHNMAAYSGSGNIPSFISFIPIPLNDYLIIPENDSVFVEYLAIDSNGENIPPTEGTGLGFNELSFRYMEGYLGQEVYEGGRDTIEIDFFDNWIRGDVYFEDPTITFNFENSFGIPTRSEINVFRVLTVRDEFLDLESEFITNGIDFPYPSLQEVGEVKSRQFVFDRTNSNIREILGSGPVAIDYDVNAVTNPDGITDIRGFITDSSFYKVRVDVDLPLYGWAINFVTRDSFDLDLSQYEGVDRAEFKLITENGMPVAIDIQGYFQDEAGVVLDSLLAGPQRLIGGAPVDLNGEPTALERVVTYSDFPQERFAKIRNAKRIVLVATFSTTDDAQQSVKVKANQDVSIRLGAIFGLQ